MNFIKRYGKKIIVIIAFGIFLLVTNYKLTASSLWYDEAIEYWYSKIMFGMLPISSVADGTVNMYQRINMTYQPPLYNFIMYFWLKVSDTEFWFRFFGVIMGFVGMIGIYKAIKKISNDYVAALAVLSSSTIYQLNYFWQECAEYCLMLAALCWTIYFWICLIQKADVKYIIAFTVMCVVSVYSQYGAVFPVIAMAFSAFIFILFTKEKRKIIQIHLSYLTAIVLAAFPLYFFFVRKQLIHQQTENVYSLKTLDFENGILFDLLYNLWSTFFENFFSYIYPHRTVCFMLITILLLMLLSVIFGKSKVIKMIVYANIGCWMCYYFMVKIGAYAYGNFGRRYSLFLIPMWIVLNYAVLFDVFSILSQIHGILRQRIVLILKFGYAMLCVCSILYCTIFNWTKKLSEHSYKSDIRGPVYEWYAYNAYNCATLVYPAADPGFAYYVRHHQDYNEHTEDNVVYMKWNGDMSIEKYIAYIDSIYDNEWPSEIYIVAANYYDDELNLLIDCFIQEGYQQEELYEIHYGKLIRLLRHCN